MKTEAVLLVVILGVWGLCIPTHAAPWEGAGTAESPYLIYDANDMQAIGAEPDEWNAHFKLMASIDLGAYTGTSFNIIGTSWESAFTGVFDGNGHTIINLTYISTGTNYVGLFGSVGTTGEINNLGLQNINVDAGNSDYVGGLIGYDYGTVTNCYAMGNVSGGDYIGGLVGYYGGMVSNCYATGNVSGNTDVGGLVGYNNYGTISDCYATGDLYGYGRVGGLVGRNRGTILNSCATTSVMGDNGIGGLVGGNSNGMVFNCYAAGSITGVDNVGGLVGSTNGTVSNCYATSDVSGTNWIGGLVGVNGFHATVSNCYATGTVSGLNFVGGLVGENYEADIFASFWDTQTSGEPNGVGYNNGNGMVRVYGRTTAEMHTQSTFTDYGWDFVGEIANGPSDDWAMPGGGGYPIMWWQLDPWPELPSFSGGTGTANDPYLIADANDLNSIGHNPRLMEKYFLLVDNIDLTGVNFFIIGNELFSFTGSFDGNGHILSNFTYTSEGTNGVGLFGYVSDGGEIKNLGLQNINIDAGNGVYVGGLVGWNDSGTVSNCYAKGNVTQTGTWSDDTGGLCGINWDTIRNCYATGSVNGTEGDIGCICGNNFTSSAIIENCFWDIETQVGTPPESVGANPNGGTITNVFGKTTVEMQTETTYTDYGWDFLGELANGIEDIWKFIRPHEDYPRLSWQPEIVGDFAGLYGVNMIDFAFFAQRWLNEDCAISKDCDGTDLDLSDTVDVADLQILSNHWLASAPQRMTVLLSLDDSWMYQNLPTATDSNLTANVSIIGDQYNNTSYTYDWEFVLPDDVTIPPIITDGGTANDSYCTFAAPSCDEPNGLSDSGQPFTVRATVTGADYGNTGTAEAQFGIALLGDANNDGAVNVADRAIINAFWRTGAAGPFTFRDCDINCDDAVNVGDRSIANAVWRGVLGENRVSSPCPLR